MNKLLLSSLLAACLAAPGFAAKFTTESAGPPPTEGVPAETIELVVEDGVAVKNGAGETVAEYWMRKAPFEGEGTSAFGVRFDTIPEGAFLGIVRYTEKGSDFREQYIGPGVYTLRYGLHPEDGNHMGVAPSRDFALLSPADKDTATNENVGDFDALMDLSFEVGNAHPTVARVELPDSEEGPTLWENDYEHWVLDLDVAGELVGLVVYGHSEE